MFRRLKIALSDPNAAIKYIFGGRKVVVRFKLSRLLQTKDSELKKYFREIDEFNEYIKSKLLSSGMKYVPPIDFGKALYIICRVVKPMTIIETGVAAGLSTSYILYALEKNRCGELHSIDMPNYEVVD
jgi:predicted O-methyltransferase YrrM